jgi:hypothetical protein
MPACCRVSIALPDGELIGILGVRGECLVAELRTPAASMYLDQQSIDTTTPAGHEKQKSSLNAYP